MAALVTDDEKNRVRWHLGYHLVESVATFALGVPAAMQTTFMIEGAMNRILSTPGAIEKFRQTLERLDCIENEIMCGIDLASVDVLDTITVRKDRLRELARYYRLFQSALANALGVVPNPWDQRVIFLLADGGINVSVMG
jgi:hypothetical protein